MGIGKYDRLARVRREAATEARRGQPQAAVFAAFAPPPAWERQHNQTQRMTIFERSWGYTAVDDRRNVVVPRTASHHYTRLPLTSDPATFYFY